MSKHIPSYREICGTFYPLKLDVGTKIKFAEEKQAYTIQASNIVFCICTKPFNARKTVLYSIIDWNNRVRGTENLIFGRGAETKKQCEEMLERLTNGESEVSSRNNCELNIDFINQTKKEIE